MEDIDYALHNLILALRSETKNTNPIAFMNGNVSFVDLMDKPDIKGFGDWMFNNGYNTALTQAELYVSHLLDKIRDSQPEVHYVGQDKYTFYQCPVCKLGVVKKEVNALDADGEKGESK